MKTPGQLVENILALGGLGLAAVYVLVIEVGLGRPCMEAVSRGFPWGMVIIVGVCVAPKTLGRATAGEVWRGLAGRFGRLSSGSHRRPKE